ncbi:hypothetical protein WGM54_14200 [Paenibacillus polymyxa]|uniref:hypothetical protein n=1 Tax=Paenibacillus polymyxa TaxID=1406 RepID=UPI00307D7A6F
MSFQLLYDQQFSRTNSVNCDCSQSVQSGFIKVLVTGEIASEGADRRLLLRLNGVNSGYKSFVRYGDSGDWGDDSGLFVGRSAWKSDGTFSLDYTIGYYSGAQKITGSGLCVFASGNDIVGFETHGYMLGNGPVRNIDVLIAGGLANGHIKIYTI